MKVLVYCPTLRLEPRTVASIFALEEVGPLDVMITYDNPHNDPYDDVLYAYRKGRRICLNDDYDAMLTIESDMIVPADALVKLSQVKADVALGVYMFRHGSVVINALRHEGYTNPGQSLSLFPGQLEAAVKKGVVETGGAGLGCTLIHRRVLERIDFRPADSGGHCDWSFTADCLRAGFVHKAHFGVKCGHIRPDGEVLEVSYEGAN